MRDHIETEMDHGLVERPPTSVTTGNLSGAEEVSAVAKIHGTYEYDDDGLTPGRKKEGGLHQNLFDGDGNLKGSARFTPDDEQPEETSGFEYWDPDLAAQLAAEMEAEERRREREQQENFELMLKVVAILGVVAYEKGLPLAQRLWEERVAPAVRARREGRARRKTERKERRNLKRAMAQDDSVEGAAGAEVEVVESTVVASASDLVVAPEADRRRMSRSEAQARYLMALAARAFSDEQLRMVAASDITEDAPILELQETLAALPPAQATQLIEQLKANPSSLIDESFDWSTWIAQVAEPSSVVEIREHGQSGGSE